MDRIDQTIHDSNRNKQVSAGIFLDFDNFKTVNDTYGHVTGDHVLIEVSDRLKASIRAADTVARLSGDEFFVLARDIKSVDQAKAFANKLLAQIKEPYSFDGEELTTPLFASIGICVFPIQRCHCFRRNRQS